MPYANTPPASPQKGKGKEKPVVKDESPQVNPQVSPIVPHINFAEDVNHELLTRVPPLNFAGFELTPTNSPQNEPVVNGDTPPAQAWAQVAPNVNLADFWFLTPLNSPRNDQASFSSAFITHGNQNQDVTQNTEDNNITDEIITPMHYTGFVTPRNTDAFNTPRNEATSSSSNALITIPMEGFVTPPHTPRNDQGSLSALSQYSISTIDALTLGSVAKNYKSTLTIDFAYTTVEDAKNIILNSNQQLKKIKIHSSTHLTDESRREFLSFLKEIAQNPRILPNIQGSYIHLDSTLAKTDRTSANSLSNIVKETSKLVKDIRVGAPLREYLDLPEVIQDYILSFISSTKNTELTTMISGVIKKALNKYQYTPCMPDADITEIYEGDIATSSSSYTISSTNGNTEGDSTPNSENGISSEDTSSVTPTNSESSSSNDATSQNTASTLANSKESTLVAQVQDDSESCERNIILPNILGNTEVSKEMMIKGYDEDSYPETQVEGSSTAKANYTASDIFEDHAAARVGFIGFASGFLGDLQGDMEAYVM